MDKKSQVIVFGLIGLSAVLGFLLFSAQSSKQLVLKEKEELTQENDSLNAKVDKLSKDLQQRQGQVSNITRDMERVSTERDDLQEQFSLVSRAKDELAAKIKVMQKQLQAQQQQPTAPSVGQSTDAYWATVLKSKTDLEMQLGTVRNEIRVININNEQLQREKSALELTLNNLERDKEDIKREMEYKQKMMDSIAQELVMERNDRLQVQVLFKTVKNENAALMRQLRTLNNHKIDMERKLKNLRDAKSAVETRVSDMENMLSGRLAQISELRDQIEAIRAGRPVPDSEVSSGKGPSVELQPIVVYPKIESASSSTSAAPGAGKVVAVNRENNFIIVDLGENVGTKIGDIFQIYRDGNWVASVEVIKVSKTVSACDIRKEEAPVKINDMVR